MSNDFKESAILVKINVSNLDDSIKWYEDKLGLKSDKDYYVPKVWAQFNTNIDGVAIGLSQNDPVGTGGAVITFSVKDIEETRESLEGSGVTVSKPSSVGKGVTLAFFKDPDGNSLGLRQN